MTNGKWTKGEVLMKQAALMEYIEAFFQLKNKNIDFDNNPLDALEAVKLFPPVEPRFEIVRDTAIISLKGTPLLRFGILDAAIGAFSTIQAIKDIVKAKEAAEVKQIVFLVSGPGGPVLGTDELAEVIYNLRSVKPCFAIVDDIAFSAHYQLAASSGGIYVTGSARLGGLGVITRYRVPPEEDEHKFLTVTASPKKVPQAEGPFLIPDETEKPASEYFLEKMQSAHDLFKKTIKVYRGMTDAQVENVFDGEVYRGSELFERKLADGFFDVEAWYSEKKFIPKPYKEA